MGLVVYICDPSTHKVEAGGLQVQIYSELYIDSEDSLVYKAQVFLFFFNGK